MTMPKIGRPRCGHRPPMRFGVAVGVLVAVLVVSGCGDDDSGGGDSAAFCEAIERSENANPFGVTPSGDREPDLDLYLAGLEGMSAAYKDAIANVPSEIKDDFEVFASEAMQIYATALAIDDPTGETVDAVIFGADVGGASDELLAFINTECGIDF